MALTRLERLFVLVLCLGSLLFGAEVFAIYQVDTIQIGPPAGLNTASTSDTNSLTASPTTSALKQYVSTESLQSSSVTSHSATATTSAEETNALISTSSTSASGLASQTSATTSTSSPTTSVQSTTSIPVSTSTTTTMSIPTTFTTTVASTSTSTFYLNDTIVVSITFLANKTVCGPTLDYCGYTAQWGVLDRDGACAIYCFDGGSKNNMTTTLGFSCLYHVSWDLQLTDPLSVTELVFQISALKGTVYLNQNSTALNSPYLYGTWTPSCITTTSTTTVVHSTTIAASVAVVPADAAPALLSFGSICLVGVVALASIRRRVESSNKRASSD